MKNKILTSKFGVFLVSVLLVFSCSPVAYGMNQETVEKGFGTAMKIGIVVLSAFLIGITAIFAYGMIRNWWKTRKRD